MPASNTGVEACIFQTLILGLAWRLITHFNWKARAILFEKTKCSCSDVPERHVARTEACGVDEYIQLVLLALKHNALLSNLLDPLAVRVNKCHIIAVERR